MPRNPTLRPHRAPSETIALDAPVNRHCNNCRHSIPIAQGLGARITYLLFGETHPNFDNCCRWQTRD